MKALKLISAALAFILAVMPLASALDVPPILNIDSNVDRANTSAIITVVANDVLDNAGLAWIKLYENGNLIETKDCDPTHSTCVLVRGVVRTSAPGPYTYRAEALDKGGNLVSQEIIINFAGVDEVAPQYSNIAASPASPVPYGYNNFSVDWTDNGRIGKVEIEHNFFGSNFRAQVPLLSGDTYQYSLNFIELGTYQWRMLAEDTAEQGANTNSTPWQIYTVVKADPNLVWTATPAAWSADVGTQTSVGCSVAEAWNSESQVELFRDGNPVSNPDVVTLNVGVHNYTCTAAATSHFNAVSESRNLTINRLPSSITLTLNTQNNDITNVERMTGTVDIVGTVNTGDNPLEIYIGGQNVASGASPVSVLAKTFNLTGTYNVTLVANQTPDYMGATATHFITVNDTVAPGPVTGLVASEIGDDYAIINWTNPTDDDLAGILFFINGTLYANLTGPGIDCSLPGQYCGLFDAMFDTSYNVTLSAYDNDGNVGVGSTIIATTLPDTTAPNVTVVSGDANYTYALDASALLEVDVDEKFDIDSVWFENDFTGFTIDTPAGGNNGNRYFLNVSGLPAGNYQWRGFANDTSGNIGLTGNVYFTVEKAASQISLKLDNAYQNVTISENGAVDINATLVLGEDGIVVYENNGTDVTTLHSGNSPYLGTRTYPTVGQYNITAVYPESANYTSSSETLFIRVVDTAAPASVTGLSATAVGNDWIYWSWTNPAELDYDSAIIYLNGVNVANTTNSFYNATGLVTESTNEILIHTKDFAGNVNTTDVNDTVILPDITSPAITVLAEPSDRLYNLAAVDHFLASVTDNRAVGTVQFEYDGVNQTVTANSQGQYEANLTGVSAMQHFYRWHASDAEGNTASTSLENYTVSKPASGVDLTLNGAKQDITVVGSITGVNVSAAKTAGEGVIYVYENDGTTVTTLYTGNGPYTELRDYTSIGNYNITVSYPETQNFSASSETYWVYVQPVIRNVSLSYPGTQIIPTDANATYTITVTNTGNVVDNFTLSVPATAFDSDIAVLSPLTVVNLAPSASATATLTVGDSSLGIYNATVHAVSDNDASATFDLNVVTEVAPYSTVIDSTILGTYYSNVQTTSIPQLYIAYVRSSTVTNADTDINNSYVQSSTVDNSYILQNSNTTSCTISNSIIRNSKLTSCTVSSSTVIDTVSSNCVIQNSYVDPSDTTGSTIRNSSTVMDSNVTYSIVDNSNITSSNVDQSTILNSEVDASVVDSNSNIDSSSITAGSTVSNSNVCSLVSTNSDVVDTNLCSAGTTTIANANITNGVIYSGTITYPNSTVYDATASGNKTLTDVVNYEPNAGISASATSITVGGSVSFTSTSTDSNIGGELNDSLAYSWRIGGTAGTQFSTNSTSSYTFSSTGTYVVALVVTDSFGASDSTTVTITVNPVSSSSSGGSRRSSSSTSSTGPRIISLIDLQPGGYSTVDLFESDMVKFMFNGAEQFVTLKDIQVDYIDMYITALSQTVQIARFDKENINLNGDMLNDISISYDGIPASRTARVTFGLKEVPSYDPIFVPETGDEIVQPEEGTQEEAEDSTGVTGGVVIEFEDNELSLWQRFVAWLKRLFGVRPEVQDDDSTDAGAEETQLEDSESQLEDAEPVVQEDAQEEPAAEEESEAETRSIWQGIASWFRSEGSEQASEEASVEESAAETEYAEAEEAFSEPVVRPVLGWFLAFLLVALAVSSYFVIRKEVMMKRLEKYL